MKVRWMRGSLRLRVSPDEFKTLLAGGEVLESLDAPGAGEWAVVCAVSDRTSITIIGGAVRFTIAQSEMEKLAIEEREGLYFTTDADPPFRYYIEKNFPCAHPHPPEARAMDPSMGTFPPTPAYEERKRKQYCE
jgi:hypothetical protein